MLKSGYNDSMHEDYTMSNISETELPLQGYRILDLSRILAGPYCTMILGDQGAEVIKVERPGTGDDTRTWGPPFAGGESAYYLCCNRNKKSIIIDLKTPEGLELVRELAKKSDVLVENFTPGLMKDIYHAGIALGGAISGEHGIGFEKKPYLTNEIDGELLNIMKRIKKAFDPNNILNPGKIFDV